MKRGILVDLYIEPSYGLSTRTKGSRSPQKVHQDNIKKLSFGEVMQLRKTNPFETVDKEDEAERLVQLNLANINTFNPAQVKVFVI